MFRIVKWTVVGGGALLLAGGFFFGREIFSYASSTRRVLGNAVKDSIPVEFEIQRARDLLEDLIPEMHANLRTVAQEEVEVAQLEREVKGDREVVARERGQIGKHRELLATLPQEAAGRDKDFVVDLSSRFERFRTSEMLLTGKEKLLTNRHRSLQAAIQKLEKTRLARVELAAQIEALEGQFRLIQAQGATSDLRIDTSKLAQTQKLLGDLRKRLEVSQRILEREFRLADHEPERPMTTQNLREELDTYFEAKRAPARESAIAQAEARL